MGKLRNGSGLTFLEHVAQICCALWCAQDLDVWLLLHASFLALLQLPCSWYFNFWPVLGSSMLQTTKYIVCCAWYRMGKEKRGVCAVLLLKGISPMAPCAGSSPTLQLCARKAVLMHKWTCLQYRTPHSLLSINFICRVTQPWGTGHWRAAESLHLSNC